MKYTKFRNDGLVGGLPSPLMASFKILCGIVNSVDPDQTAPSGAGCSGSALFAYANLSTRAPPSGALYARGK